MIRALRHRVPATWDVTGPALLLSVGFGIGFTLAAAWATAPY